MFADRVLQVPTLTRNMREDDVWQLNRRYVFEHEAELKLWDEDVSDKGDLVPIDSDDLLGRALVARDPVMHAEATFSLDDAHYTLRYSVIDVPPPAIRTADDALQSFQASKTKGVWPNINKQELVEQIRARIKNPVLVSQDGTPLCGPAAITYELVSHYPRRYIDIVRQLYETGKFLARTYTFAPSDDFIKSAVGAGIEAVDWMVLGAIRDSENWFFDIEPDSPKAAGITSPWEMRGWSWEILGYDFANWDSTFVWGEFDALRSAQEAVNRGGVAFLMVESAMLGKETVYPNHWISFAGNLTIDVNVEFRCFSWGRVYDVELGKGAFDDYMYGVVVAT